MLRGTTALAGGYDIHLGVVPGQILGENLRIVRRSKEAEEKQFSASWYISGPDDKLKDIFLEWTEWDDEARSQNSIQDLDKMLTVRGNWAYSDLHRKSGLREAEFKDWLERMQIAGRLTLSSSGKTIRVEPETP